MSQVTIQYGDQAIRLHRSEAEYLREALSRALNSSTTTLSANTATIDVRAQRFVNTGGRGVPSILTDC